MYEKKFTFQKIIGPLHTFYIEKIVSFAVFLQTPFSPFKLNLAASSYGTVLEG